MTNKYFNLIISSGNGPAECQYAVKQVYYIFLKEAKDNSVHILEKIKIAGDKSGTFKSALLKIDLKFLNMPFIQNWLGTVKWICESPFRKNHKRKNWFITISAVENNEKLSTLKDKIIIKTSKASGPGGQNVNKRDTAVQLINEEAGIIINESRERSQYLNKKLAFEKLDKMILQKKEEKRMKLEKDNWMEHYKIERGNEIKVFKGPGFREVKGENIG